MGVSGSGKSTVGQLLANELSIQYVDGDDHHPKSNIEKMTRGIPLNDKDREPWLDRLHEIALNHLDSGCVIGCSALKKDYRKRLADSIESKVRWVYLQGSYEQIFERLSNRNDHFMGTDLLKSQFETLEEPANAIRVSIEAEPEVIVRKIKAHLQ